MASGQNINCDPYEVLGLNSVQFSLEELRKQYYTMAKKTHTEKLEVNDQNLKNSSCKNVDFATVSACYEMLADDELREIFDGAVEMLIPLNLAWKMTILRKRDKIAKERRELENTEQEKQRIIKMKEDEEKAQDIQHQQEMNQIYEEERKLKEAETKVQQEVERAQELSKLKNKVFELEQEREQLWLKLKMQEELTKQIEADFDLYQTNITTKEAELKDKNNVLEEERKKFNILKQEFEMKELHSKRKIYNESSLNAEKKIRFEKKAQKTKIDDTMVQNQVLKCYICDKTFNHKNSLSRHMRTYLYEYTCVLCQAIFTRTDTLKKHIKTHKD